MAVPNRRFLNVQDNYTELEKELNRLTIVGDACFPMGNYCR